MTDMIADLIAAIAVIVGIPGLIVGLLQYRNAQKWKKSEFGAKQLEKLSSDPSLSLCCTILDWRQRNLPVPKDYQAFAPEEWFSHDWEILSNAMQTEEKKYSFEWQEIMYRDLFDIFFGYLELIDHFIAIKLISVSDVENLRYWLQQIQAPRFVDDKAKAIFLDFIRYYKYEGVLDLMKRFNLPTPSDSEV